MKRWNVLAASLIAATFVFLALLPLTRDALRFDARMAMGRSVMGPVLVNDMGVRQENMPLGGIGPEIPVVSDSAAANSSDFSLRLASALHLPGREKWAALQRLVADFPNEPAAHAALARMACKNGGSVGVGHDAEQYELTGDKLPDHPAVPDAAAQAQSVDDARIMLRSCDAGERLDPDNAYFPAMATVAYLALNRDEEARLALHRAATFHAWREYIDVEVRGSVRRAELLYGPQNTLSEGAIMASVLFPHYAALRSMARVMAAKAMYAERDGAIGSGIDTRNDVARVGSTMRQEASTLIGGLVGMAMVRVAEQRPGGAPALKAHSGDGYAWRKQTDERFLAYLTSHGRPDDANRWRAYQTAETQTRAITSHVGVSTFNDTTFMQTGLMLFANLALIAAAVFLCALAGAAFARPLLEQYAGKVASVAVLAVFAALAAWGLWHVLGALREYLAFASVLWGLSGDESGTTAGKIYGEWQRTLAFEVNICLAALFLPLLYLALAALLAKVCGLTMGTLLRRWTLPLAALVTLGYAAHVLCFSLRERMVRAELQQTMVHEGRHIAGKLGKVWPVTPELLPDREQQHYGQGGDLLLLLMQLPGGEPTPINREATVLPLTAEFSPAPIRDSPVALVRVP